jgi:hypothetical protein
MQFLLIARVVEGVAMEQVLLHVKAEAEAVWQKYTAQIVRSIHYIADNSGAILMCEAANLEAMQEIAAQFPMVKAGVLKIEVLPLKPYTGLASLFAQ